MCCGWVCSIGKWSKEDLEVLISNHGKVPNPGKLIWPDFNLYSHVLHYNPPAELLKIQVQSAALLKPASYELYIQCAERTPHKARC